MKLEELARTHKTDKLQHGYLSVYDSVFSKFKDKEINFLEIGVYRGDSASLWGAYFSCANIFMSDIFDKTSILSDYNVKFFRGDSGSAEDVAKLIEYAKEKSKKDTFDVIIDDGSHFQYDQMNGIGNLFPHVSDGGCYIIEDICKEERLRSGSMWWGHRGEPHHAVEGNCHAGSRLRTDKEWLAGDEIDYSASTDATIKKFVETQVFCSKYLSEDQNEYITNNTKKVEYYSGANGLKCQSKLAVFEK